MKYLYWLLGVAVLVGLVYWAYKTPSNNQPTDKVETEAVVVFLTKMTETDMEFVPVDRTITKTNQAEEMILLTIRELLKGPTAAEKEQGLAAAFNAGTEVNYVRISGNTLIVDFNETFDFQMGGSARVTSISQSLNRTIRQFPIEGVAEIKFTVNNGEREAVLEP